MTIVTVSLTSLRRCNRDVCAFVVLVGLLVWATPARLCAQGSSVPSDSAAASTPAETHKSVVVASLLGLAFPGSAHWYAGETRRGAIIAAIYYPSVLVMAAADPAESRSWGPGPKAAGLLWLGALAFSWIDGTLAAQRANARLVLTMGSHGACCSEIVRLGLSISQ